MTARDPRRSGRSRSPSDPEPQTALSHAHLRSYSAGVREQQLHQHRRSCASKCVLWECLPEAAQFLTIFFLCISMKIPSVSDNEPTQPRGTLSLFCIRAHTQHQAPPTFAAAEQTVGTALSGLRAQRSGLCSPRDSQALCPMPSPPRRGADCALTFMYFTSSSVFFSSSCIISLWNVLNC